MGFITDNLRGPSKTRRAALSITAPENQPPQWMAGIGAAIGAGALVVVIGYSVVTGLAGDEVNATAPAREQNVIAVDPYAPDPEAAAPEDAPTGGAPTSAAPTAEAPPEVGEAPDITDDFGARNMVTVGITDTPTTAQSPAGALNLAAAGFNAMITGEWTPLPKTAAPILPTPRSGATLDPSTITISPASASSGGKNFTFTATFVTAEGNQEKSQLTVVSKTDGSYQIRPL